MSILILNRVSRDLCAYDEWLKDEELIFLTSDEYEHDFNPDNFTYFESFPNYNHNGCVELRALELYEKFKYRAVIGVSERDVLRASWLRERLGLPGQNMSSAYGFRNKIHMKEIAQKAGLTVPPFAQVDNSFDLIEFVEGHGYPVVVKPVDSAGAVGTTVLENKQDLEKYLSVGVPQNMDVETFVDGEFYHVDGLIYQGELRLICVSHYVLSCLSYHEDGFTGSYLIDQESELAKRMKNEVKKFLAEVETPEHTTIHAEFFHTPNDEVVFCEIASRTGGARINVTVDQAYGVNLNQAWIYAQLGIPLDLPASPKPKDHGGALVVPPKAGTFISIDDREIPEWVTEFRLLASPGEKFHGPASSVDHMGSLAITAETPEQAFERIFEGKKWFDNATTWEL